MISLLVENVEELNLFVFYEHCCITECNNMKLRLVTTCKNPSANNTSQLYTFSLYTKSCTRIQEGQMVH